MQKVKVKVKILLDERVKIGVALVVMLGSGYSSLHAAVLGGLAHSIPQAAELTILLTH